MYHGRQRSRNHSFDGTILRGEADDLVKESAALDELGSRFEADKALLESEIEKVQNSRISDENKKALIAKLDDAIAALQKQYDKDVTENLEDVHSNLEACTEDMQEAADDLEEEGRDLRGIRMDASLTDASAAADAAEAKKKEFEDMKHEYVEKLELQIQQANLQKRNILARRLRGR